MLARHTIRTLLPALLLALAGCGTEDPPPTPEPPAPPRPRPDASPPPPPPPPPPDAAAFDVVPTMDGPPGQPPFTVSYLDQTVSPCDDFYKYACGGLFKQSPLGPTSSGYSTYHTASSDISRFVNGVIDQAVAERSNPSAAPEMVAIGNYYQRCTEAATDLAPRQTLRALLAMVDPIASLDDLALVSAELRKRGSHAFFVLYAGVDPGATTDYVLTLDQGARQLPNRDYYFDPALATVRDRYRAHIPKLAKLLDLTIDGDAVLRVETAIAMSELTPAEKRDPVATYNKMPLANALALSARFPWQRHLEALGIAMVGMVNVIAPAAVKGMDPVLALPIEDLKHYLRWQLLADKAEFLDQAVTAEVFDFQGRAINGAVNPPSVRSTCLTRTRERFAWQLGRRYVEQHFPMSTRAEVAAFVASIRATFKRRLEQSPWLDAPTREQALAKLAAVGEKIAYPDSFPMITMVPQSKPLLVENLESSMRNFAGIVSVLGLKTDRTRWSGSEAPIVVNAFYSPTYNQIILPAGLMRLPHFDARRPAVANYGAIGRTVGHEFTHGFDDAGRRRDATGSLRDWWSPAVNAEFAKRADCLGAHFARFEVLPGRFVDPRLTMGENLADLGGMRLALEAYLGGSARSPEYVGFSDLQQFFIASAQARCSLYSADYKSKLLLTDSHAPDEARVNVIFAQMPEFGDAFKCAAGTRMRAEPICTVW